VCDRCQGFTRTSSDPTGAAPEGHPWFEVHVWLSRMSMRYVPRRPARQDARTTEESITICCGSSIGQSADLRSQRLRVRVSPVAPRLLARPVRGSHGKAVVESSILSGGSMPVMLGWLSAALVTRTMSVRLALLAPSPRSSAGQSSAVLTRRSGVRIPPGRPNMESKTGRAPVPRC
jgi:hypothetical protein